MVGSLQAAIQGCELPCPHGSRSALARSGSTCLGPEKVTLPKTNSSSGDELFSLAFSDRSAADSFYVLQCLHYIYNATSLAALMSPDIGRNRIPYVTKIQCLHAVKFAF